ncbi:4a-hydroxytetrahydrobiopterin dehydratase [Cyclonatronum proteinivorum]|uniref:Putative pterin-4-alpha-carbinolamine dehydratase n=1 Tax=Cyclonatronum proteinivorum TaxID=1457365 RepID=A0A345UN68_9BACT|nr:4a-hydroxytetrahydrobiopterin dehydratase [Cyclonatronum proteinivorum]AXJ01920.1 4a-hydroxytetrahydrobiopterin dehydratase [Cyclonatronum proteinivorum]
MSTQALTEKQVQQALEELEEWEYENDALTVAYKFSNFPDALAFIVRIGFIAEELAHHPEIYNVYSTVEIRLTTHDAGNKVTEKDVEFAKRIDNLEM